MNERSSKAKSDGAFNAASRELSGQLKDFTPTFSSLKDLNKGAKTTAASKLSVTVVTERNATAEFVPPSSKKVEQDMETMLSTKPPRQKKRRKGPAPQNEKLV